MAYTPASLTNHTHSGIAASTIAFTPTGTIAATDVQAAVAEVAVEAGSSAHDIHGSQHTDALKPTGVITETIPRSFFIPLGNNGVLATGRMHLTAVYLPTGTLVTSITYLSSGTLAGTPTNQWFALYDNALGLCRQTVDDTTTAWAANSFKTLALTSTFNTTYSGLHYVGIMVAAATPPTLASATGIAAMEDIQNLAPKTNGSSTTGLTTTAPSTASLSANSASAPYAYLS